MVSGSASALATLYKYPSLGSISFRLFATQAAGFGSRRGARACDAHFAIAAVAAEAADGVAVAVGAEAVAGAGNANAIECGSPSVHCLCRFWPAFWPEFGFGLLAHFG